LATAASFDIKLFVVESERLITHLNEEELKLLEESDNSSIIEAHFRINRIILGIFESDSDKNQTVRH
jgi:hypothetical protein